MRVSDFIGAGDPGDVVADQNQRRAPCSHPDHGRGERRLGCSEIHGELLKLGFEISERTVRDI